MLNPDHWYTVPTPGTTPPRSSHGLTHSQQQSQLGGGLLNTHVMGSNMAMLNMSLPTTSASMDQLIFTSHANQTEMMGVAGIGMSSEQKHIYETERSLQRANANATEGGNIAAGIDMGAGAYTSPGVRPYPASGGLGRRMGRMTLEGMDMSGVELEVGMDELNEGWGWRPQGAGGGRTGGYGV